MKPIHVRTFYPADPVGVIPGGVDTFIRGLIKWAPADIQFSLVGVTTDSAARPLGRWSRCNLGARQFDFFPVVNINNAAARSHIPLSLRFTAGALRHWTACAADFDVYDFHRVEPALIYLKDRRPKNAFFHTDMSVIRTESKSDIVWKKIPGLYFRVESLVLKSMSSVWSVREQAAEALRMRYPDLARNIFFTPTWLDTETFFPVDVTLRSQIRAQVEMALGLDSLAFRVMTVGRLDTSKDPDLLLSAVAKLLAEGVRIELLFVGDGVLRAKLEKRVADEGLKDVVRFLGLRNPSEIARILQSADCFALSSVYEGMPIALLEALGAGIPVVTTPVGEVGRVVTNGFNGEVVADRSIESLSAGINHVRCNSEKYTVLNCVRSVDLFEPAKVLEPIYENYRRISGRAFVE